MSMIEEMASQVTTSGDTDKLSRARSLADRAGVWYRDTDSVDQVMARTKEALQGQLDMFRDPDMWR